MKKLFFLLLMVGSMTIAAKADNPPTDNENATSVTEEISESERPDCIPNGWRYDGSYWGTTARGDGSTTSFEYDVWSSNTCGDREYKVSLDDRCYVAHYDGEYNVLIFYKNGDKWFIYF